MNETNFLIFEKGKHPTLEGYDDPVIFYVVNAGAIINGKNNELKEITKKYSSVNEKTGSLEFDNGKNKELYKELLDMKILEDVKIAALGTKAGLYLRILEKLGANSKQLVIGKDLFSENDEKFDIVFSSGHFDPEELKKFNSENIKKFALDYFCKAANLTKFNGYNIHSYGEYISTLYNLFFQVIGFDISEYFRNDNSVQGFTIILRKINDQHIDKEKADYLYEELKHRNPIRYR